MPRLPLVSVTLMSLLTLGGCSHNYNTGSWTTERYTHESLATHAPSQQGELQQVAIKNRNGSIDVRASASDEIRVEANIQARSEERAEAAMIRIDESDDRVNIAVAFPSEYQPGDGATLRVWLPETTTLTAESSNGAIVVEGVSQTLRITTSNGRIAVIQPTHDVELITSNGSISVGDVGSSAVLRTSNGRVSVGKSDGDLRVSTSNGRVSTGPIHGSASITTSNGRIQLGPVRGKVSASTSNGRVAVTLHPEYQGKLTARSSRGSDMEFEDSHHFVHPASVSIERNRLSLSVGDATQTSTINTSNASISIEVSGEDAG